MNLRRCAEQIYKAALTEVDPENLIRQNVAEHKGTLIVQNKVFDLSRFKSIHLAAIGKAAPFMARGLLELLGDRIKSGIFLYLPQSKISLERLNALPASHPLPDERSLLAARSIMDLARGLDRQDLLFVLISGGGSAQVALPAEGISLDTKRQITDKLLKAGADIQELNTVRKHLSAFKGGRLAQMAFPASVISLVISDVIHNDLETIASGPTYWDSTTFQAARQILEKYKLWNSLPLSAVEIIEKGIRGEIGETLRKEDPIFARVSHGIIGDNQKALLAAKLKARQLGFRAFILTSSDQGEARVAARNYLSMVSNLMINVKQLSPPLCLLSGGEFTVTVKGEGKGGRNQEFILAALGELASQKFVHGDWLILSLGTDGIDGPTDAAGAWISPSSLQNTRRLSLDISEYLDDNNSYNFFKQTGGLIHTGPTHTNVMDIREFLFSGA